jgi:heme/copper-type cytochrome/quinol oxidase subunit 2
VKIISAPIMFQYFIGHLHSYMPVKVNVVSESIYQSTILAPVRQHDNYP